MTDSLEPHMIDLGDALVACYVAGVGADTIVLLHGAGVDSALLSWREVIPLLASGHRVVAIDLPGYGASDRIEREHSLAFYTNVISRAIDVISPAPVILAGLSLGGGIALNVALTNPALVKALVPVDAWGLFEKLPWHRIIYWYVNSWLNDHLYAWTNQSRAVVRWSLETNLFGDKSRVTDELVDEVQRAMQEPDAGKPFISFQRSEITPTGLRTNLFGRLGAITQPTLIVHGTLDTAVPLAGALEAGKRIPNCEVYLMEGCKHWPQKERPEEFSRALLSWLEKRAPDSLSD